MPPDDPDDDFDRSEITPVETIVDPNRPEALKDPAKANRLLELEAMRRLLNRTIRERVDQLEHEFRLLKLDVDNLRQFVSFVFKQQPKP